MDAMVYEEWLVDWAGNAGEPVICSDYGLAIQYAITNIPAGAIWRLSKRVISVTPHAMYGLPSSLTPPTPPNAPKGIAVAITHTHVTLANGGNA